MHTDPDTDHLPESAEYGQEDDIDLTPVFQEALEAVDRLYRQALSDTESTYTQAHQDLDPDTHHGTLNPEDEDHDSAGE